MLKKPKNLWLIALVILLTEEAMNQFFISFTGITDNSTKVVLRVVDAISGMLVLIVFAAVPAVLLSFVPFCNKAYRIKFRYLLPLIVCIFGLFLFAFNIYRLYLKSKGEYIDTFNW